MASKGKGKPLRRSRRLSGAPVPTSSPTSTSTSTMLVVVGNKFGITREYFCEHAFLVGLEGRQRPLAKFLTGEMVTELQQLVPATRATYEKYIEDSNNYEYTAEPEGGDIDSDDEEFRIDPFADGRYFTNALFFDFIEKFGRKAKTGDKASSSAYIIKPPFE